MQLNQESDFQLISCVIEIDVKCHTHDIATIITTYFCDVGKPKKIYLECSLSIDACNEYHVGIWHVGTRLVERPPERSSYHENVDFGGIVYEQAGVTVVSCLKVASELLISLDGCYDKIPVKTRQNNLTTS